MEDGERFEFRSEPGSVLDAASVFGFLRHREAFTTNGRAAQAIILVSGVVAKFSPMERMVNLGRDQLRTRQGSATAAIDDALLAAFDDGEEYGMLHDPDEVQEKYFDPKEDPWIRK